MNRPADETVGRQARASLSAFHHFRAEDHRVELASSAPFTFLASVAFVKRTYDEKSRKKTCRTTSMRGKRECMHESRDIGYACITPGGVGERKQSARGANEARAAMAPGSESLGAERFILLLLEGEISSPIQEMDEGEAGMGR